MRGGFDKRRTAAIYCDPRLSGPSPVRVDRRRHTLPDQVALVAHRPGFRSAPVPAEACRSPGEAFAESARGERSAAIRIGIGVIAEAQLDWIDAGRVRQFVHGALEGKMALRLHGRPQHDGRVAIHVDDSVARGDPAAGTPQVAAGYSGVFDVIVEHRCWVDAVMADAGQLAVAARAESNCLDGCGLMTDHRVHLCAAKL